MWGLEVKAGITQKLTSVRVGVEPIDNAVDQALVVHQPVHASTGTRDERQRWDAVAKGDVLLVIESMKMEIEIQAATAGVVRELLCKPGQAVTTGQALAVLEVAN